MYVIELFLKFNPLPLSVERKELVEAQAVYKKVCDGIQKGESKIIELNCQKIESKKISVLLSEVLAVQLYEKTTSIGGVKRPGFSYPS